MWTTGENRTVKVIWSHQLFVAMHSVLNLMLKGEVVGLESLLPLHSPHTIYDLQVVFGSNNFLNQLNCKDFGMFSKSCEYFNLKQVQIFVANVGGRIHFHLWKFYNQDSLSKTYASEEFELTRGVKISGKVLSLINWKYFFFMSMHQVIIILLSLSYMFVMDTW